MSTPFLKKPYIFVNDNFSQKEIKKKKKDRQCMDYPRLVNVYEIWKFGPDTP